MNLNILGTKDVISVSDFIFSCKFNKSLVHQVVVSYLACGRQGSSKQKNRSEVRGGGRKPWRQKGSGRARVGTIRSPIWVGGGCTFASRPRKYLQKINRKVYRKAMCCILSELLRCKRLVIVSKFIVSGNHTRSILSSLEFFGCCSILIVTEDIDSSLFLSSRNLPNVEISDVSRVSPVLLLKTEKVVLTLSSLAKVEEWLS